MKLKIAVLAGDGIGPEIMKQGVAIQSCPTLCDPRECSPSGSSVHVIFQARVLE